MKITCSFFCTITGLISQVSSHARLLEPPSRSSMWRMGYPSPPDYQDNEGFCGGYQVQWDGNGGKCGVCGDAYNAPVKEHEAPGGRYANGIIVRKYQPGDTMNITVEVTANHMGFFMFRMCPAETQNKDPEEECFNRPEHLLTVLPINSAEYLLPSKETGKYRLSVQLPSHLECEHCLIQWTYTTGNNWGVCPDGVGRVGCGPQETFRACADVSIKKGSQHQLNFGSHVGIAVPAVPGYHPVPAIPGYHPVKAIPGYHPVQAIPDYPSFLAHVPVPHNHLASKLPPASKVSYSKYPPPYLLSCTPVGPYIRVPGMVDWCNLNCGHGPAYCPPSHCHCL